MTDIEKLILEGIAALIQLGRDTATSAGVYHGGGAKVVQDKIEAALNSATADEIDVLR